MAMSKKAWNTLMSFSKLQRFPAVQNKISSLLHVQFAVTITFSALPLCREKERHSVACECPLSNDFGLNANYPQRRLSPK